MHYHLIGICGTAMASLAGMLQARGHRVTGSDQDVYPPMSSMLESLRIPVYQGYDPARLTPSPGCVVVGNAIPRGNVELEETLNRKLLYHSQAELIKEEFIRGRRSLVVAGTHGKTTTTSLAAWVMECGGLRPGFLIGGVAQNFGTSFRVSESDYFIIEGDEYDTAWFDKGPKFMHYLPEVAILNNIEFDHADIYPDLNAVKLAFRRFINMVPQNGRLIAGVDSINVRELLADMAKRLFTRVETFGTDPSATWQARDIVIDANKTSFVVFREGVPWAAFRTPMCGDFNVRNCLATVAAASTWGVAPALIQEGIATFKSVKRRMETLGEKRGIVLIDDFAHHPTAVRETLTAVKARYPHNRVFAVFEPRSWSSRLSVFQNDYASALGIADHVTIAAVFGKQKATEKGEVLDTQELARQISGRGVPAVALENPDDMISRLVTELCSGDTVVFMSNGGFGGIQQKLLSAL